MDNFSQPVRVHLQHSSDCEEEGAGEMEPPPRPPAYPGPSASLSSRRFIPTQKPQLTLYEEVIRAKVASGNLLPFPLGMT